jgi:cold shock CspA family protein
MSEKDRNHGTVAFWGDRKFGFIKPDSVGSNIFFHVSACESGEEPRIGDRVTYEVAADRRDGRPARICAKQVRLAEPRVCAPSVRFGDGM